MCVCRYCTALTCNRPIVGFRKQCNWYVDIFYKLSSCKWTDQSGTDGAFIYCGKSVVVILEWQLDNHQYYVHVASRHALEEMNRATDKSWIELVPALEKWTNFIPHRRFCCCCPYSRPSQANVSIYFIPTDCLSHLHLSTPLPILLHPTSRPVSLYTTCLGISSGFYTREICKLFTGCSVLSCSSWYQKFDTKALFNPKHAHCSACRCCFPFERHHHRIE